MLLGLYQDPDGAWALTFLSVSYGAGVTITTPAWLPLAAGAAAGAAIGYLGYKLYENYQTHQAAKEVDRLFPEMADPYSPATFNNQGLLNIPGQDSFLDRDYLNQRMDAHKAKEGKQKDGCPKPNDFQKKQFNDALKEIEKMLGKRLNKEDRKRLHRQISKQNYDYHDIVKEGYWMFYE